LALVIDSSAALALALPDEEMPIHWRQRIYADLVWVPGIWPLETSNGLLMAVRRGRLDPTREDVALSSLQNLGIVVDSEGWGSVWRRTFELARSQGLTTYDAAYVELALRRNLPLLTLDAAMRAAARRLGVDAPDP
jgi:predicted nucleic acid-binding protein